MRFEKNVSPEAFDSLEHFSHIWVVFVFHLNTNSKAMRAHSNLQADSKRHTFPAKIAPPMLKARVGVFSTRTPHRPNPIGVTLVRLEKINKRELVVSGA